MQLKHSPLLRQSHRYTLWGVWLWLLATCYWTPHCSADQPLDHGLLRARAELGLRLIESSSKEYLQQRECFSCHHQSLPLLAFQQARLRGLQVDLDNLAKQAERSIEHLKRGEQTYREGRGQGGKVDMAGYALWGLNTVDWSSDSTTGAVVEYLLQAHASEGHWTCESNRPPSEVSDITTSALALKGLAAFADSSLSSRVAKRRRDCAAWLRQQKPEDTESRVFGLLAAKELGMSETVHAMAGLLLESQRADGGWAQLSEMESDAYATATALFALAQSENATESAAYASPAYSRGLRYLLDTQQSDGSWHVVSRSRPFQTYFESGFPHGKDQFISIAASCWAIMSILQPLPPVVKATSLQAQLPWHTTGGKSTTASGIAQPPLATEAELEFFEREVRPLLAERCGSCHGTDKQFANLRTDNLASLLAGGDSGPALVPRHTERSLLIQAVRRQGELKMPPDDPLAAAEVARLERWIAMGAPWPANSATPADARREAAQQHWAFQPIKQAALPSTDESTWTRSAIDQFVLAKLESQSLHHSAVADQRTLLRRLSYDLLGLPPRFEDYESFQSDHRPDAYERMVDRWLASPRFGEQWGRHWLDIARYSDTKGYVYAREERVFVHAAMYRDWVIAAFNSDLPFDRFVEHQLAADQLATADPPAQAAMGFLTLGRRFLGVTHDIADDRIDVVTRGLLGLTVACARCHDHKFDPISSAEYYALAGVFHNSTERRVSTRVTTAAPADASLEGPSKPTPFDIELAKRQAKYHDRLAAERTAAAERVRAKFKDYLLAQLELEKIPAEGFDVIIGKEDLVPAQVRHVQAYLLASAGRQDPIFGAWNRYAAIPASEFAQAAPRVTAELKRQPPEELNVLVARCFATAPASMQEVAQRYGELFARVNQPDSTDSIEQQAASALRDLLYDPHGPAAIPDEDIVSIEQYFASSVCTELWKLQGEIDRWINQSQTPADITTVLVDRSAIREPHVLRRGNPRLIGEQVPRQFLSVATPLNQAPWSLTSGSGRRELAAAIIHPDNPLTLRVWTNRLWQHLFGAGLVASPSDFGLRAAPPSHPELLDWLAIYLRSHDHSSKQTLRQMLLSATYRQASFESPKTTHYARAQEIDPENRLLWRVSPKRLTFEQQRDSWLAVAQGLEESIGGRGRSMFDEPASNSRRSVYGLVDRQFLPGVMRVFDFANPDLHTPQRSETTVPQQALFALNHPFAAHAARSAAMAAQSSWLAARSGGGATQQAPMPEQGSIDARITLLFRMILGRSPEPDELVRAQQFIDQTEQLQEKPRQEPLAWSYGYAKFDPEAGTLGPFTQLPHFSGTAWQGGPQWPDKKLGWVQLSAVGGHAGNDLEHAAVRRWTASQAGTYTVRSIAVHDAQAGDGIRCSIISSRAGLLKSSLLHNQKIELQVTVDAMPGDTLDFVVDIHGNLNNDQFQWAPEIVLQPLALEKNSTANQSTSSPTHWRADSDFSGPVPAQLDTWAQLAQVLLLSNELTFVD